MPFQIALSYKRNKPPAVILLSAGTDQQISCADSITLSAIVDDELLLPGHPLEWEQLEGNPVILSCPTCLTTTYPLIDLTDKTFRFWIDRGTVDEQYDDVEIFHTPTSHAPSQTYGDTDVTYGVPASSPICDDILATAVVPPIIPDHSGDIPGAGVGIEWGLVERVDLQPYVTQYTVLENGVPVKVVPVSDPRVYDPAIEAVYQIFTEFLVLGQYSSELSCERDYINDLELPSVIFIDESVPHQTFGDTTYTRTNFGNIVNNESVSSAPNQTFGDTTYTRTNFGNIVNSGSTSEAPNQTFGDTSVSVTRFDSGGIGG